MKKMFVLAITLVLAVGFVGCAKEDNAPATKDIKVQFEVADKGCFADTRAVKTAWADGDQIAVFFQPEGLNVLCTEDSMDNTLVLTYSKSVGWSAMKNNWSEELINSISGYFFAIHYRGNIAIGKEAQSNLGYYFKNYDGGEILLMQDAPYSITDGVMDLGTLDLNLERNAVQFSVQKMASNTDDWEMAVTYDDKYYEIEPGRPFVNAPSSPVTGYLNDDKQFYITKSSCYMGKFSGEWMCDAVNREDRSFYARFDGKTVTEKYIFVLKNVTKNKYYRFDYAPVPFLQLESGAYLLPPLTLEADGVTPAAGCLWSGTIY